MAYNNEPKVTRIGVNTITEYPDGTKVIEQNGHKVTQNPDGTMVLDANGGHRTVIDSAGNSVLTINYSALKHVYPKNLVNVVSVSTVTNASGITKIVTFTNGGTVSCSYGLLGEVVSISAKDVNSFSFNKAGDEFSFDISDTPSNLDVH